MEYLLHIAVLVCIYAILAISLDLLVGQTGLLSIAHAAFVGLGAYTSALLAIRLGAPFLVGVLSGMAVAAIASFFVSLPSLRLHEDYFVIATFALQMIVFGIFNNWLDLTEGPLGIPGIPQPSVLGWTIDSHVGFLIVGATAALLTFAVAAAIGRSPLGRVLRAIREDEIFTKALAKNTVMAKVQIVAVSAALAAVGGSLYAHYVTYIDPTSFTVAESILLIAMVILGGAGSLWGPVIGATVLVILPEALRFAGLPSPVAANLRQIIYGILLVMIIMYRPRGIIGRYGFGR